ncbi:MarR family transcriptional regulator [Candidatus Woesearchaeota archaeon]|nr:MarR family transcriptional regulator [Candidatus Woesearchaeota archaeon]
MKKYLSKFNNNKWLGLVISVISVAILIILASFSIKIAKIDAARCVHPTGAECPITAHIPSASYAAAILLIIIFILGIKVALKSGAAEKISKDAADKSKTIAKALRGDEKKIYEVIIASHGAVFQSELVEKMGYSKVKVSRILDKLEGQNLIERNIPSSL